MWKLGLQTTPLHLGGTARPGWGATSVCIPRSGWAAVEGSPQVTSESGTQFSKAPQVVSYKHQLSKAQKSHKLVGLIGRKQIVGQENREPLSPHMTHVTGSTVGLSVPRPGRLPCIKFWL